MKTDNETIGQSWLLTPCCGAKQWQGRCSSCARELPLPAAVVAREEGDGEGCHYVLSSDQAEAYAKLKAETGFSDEELLDCVEFCAGRGQLLAQTSDPYELWLLARAPGSWGYCYDSSSDFRDSPERVALILGDESGADLAAQRRANYPWGFHVTADEDLLKRRILCPQDALRECPHELVSLDCWAAALKLRARQLGRTESRWEGLDGETLCTYSYRPHERWSQPGLFDGDYCRAERSRRDAVARADFFSVWLPRVAMEALQRELKLEGEVWQHLPIAQRDLRVLYLALHDWYLGEEDGDDDN